MLCFNSIFLEKRSDTYQFYWLIIVIIDLIGQLKIILINFEMNGLLEQFFGIQMEKRRIVF